MKKNFLKIAALLIAAMLLVVSCSQEVKAPEAEDNGLVEARLSVGFGRDLIVGGYTKTETLVYKYTMTQGWTNPTVGYDEPVIGNTNGAKQFTNGKSIGYVTPGLWNITVDAYESIRNTETGTTTEKKIFTGKASVYFSSQNQSATVFLEPVNDTENSITFDFYMQDLGKTYGEDFKVEYTISKNGSAVDGQKNVLFKGAEQVVEVNKTGSDNTSVYDNQKNYKKTVGNLDSGYYTVTVAVYVKGENGLELKGGITKGFLISNGANATITGHIEPSDYENVVIDSVFVNVDTSLAVSYNNTTLSLVNDKYYEVAFNNSGDYVLTVRMTDDTDKSVIPEGATVTKTLFWNSEDGVDVTSEQTSNVYSEDFHFSSPGHKYITCTTVYSVTGASTGMGSDTYYFADSKTVHVYLNPANYSENNN